MFTHFRLFLLISLPDRDDAKIGEKTSHTNQKIHIGNHVLGHGARTTGQTKAGTERLHLHTEQTHQRENLLELFAGAAEKMQSTHHHRRLNGQHTNQACAPQPCGRVHR